MRAKDFPKLCDFDRMQHLEEQNENEMENENEEKMP